MRHKRMLSAFHRGDLGERFFIDNGRGHGYPDTAKGLGERFLFSGTDHPTAP